MNNAAEPLSTLESIVAAVGYAELNSDKPDLRDNQQWVSLPGLSLGFVCDRLAPEAAVNELRQRLTVLHSHGEHMSRSLQTLVDREEMERLAMLDPLTELPNRRKLFDCLTTILSNNHNSAILQIDLDRFKQINDSLGHAAGDEVLIVVANRLAAKIRPGDLVARIGGDEFVVACPEVHSVEAMAELAERLIASLNEPMQLQGHMYDVGVSIGVAFKQAEHNLDPETLLQNADLALYTSKEQGRNQYHLYEPTMRAKFDAVQSMKKELSDACDNGSIVAHYQPIFCLNSGLVAGIQAMARWQHSSLGLLTYGEFEQHADEKVLKNVDKMMLNQCLQGIRSISEENSDVSKFSVTASSKRMRDPEFVSYLLEETTGNGLSPTQLSLDIVTNCTSNCDADLLQKNIEEVKNAGFGISLTNFGGNNTGFQSLLQLQPHSIKLDGSMCRGLKHDKTKQQLIAGMVSLTEQLNTALIATMVETESDRDILLRLGCTFVQGNIIAPPSDIASLATWLHREQTRLIKVA